MSNHIEREVNPTNRAERHYKEFNGDIDIFVPKSQEQEYLSRHGIEMRHLPNGIMIAGATRRVEDNAHAEIEMVFPSGAYHEPAGKNGINHLLEHLISNKPGFLAAKNEAYFNATTSPYSLSVDMKGTANPNVRSYGIWPVIPAACEQLINPLDITEAALGNEKGVVFGELRRRSNNPEDISQRIFNEIVYSRTNPANCNSGGTEETVRLVTLEEIRERYESVFIPYDLEVGVFTEGSPEITNILMSEIESHLKDMPRQEKRPQRVDEELSAELNPDFKQGQMYAKDTGLKNGMVTVNYLWTPSVESYSTSTFALLRFFDVANQKMFRFFRESGLGYNCSPIASALGTKKNLFGFRMDLPKREGTQDFTKGIYPYVKERVFETFSDEDISYINDITHRRLEAIPITVGERFNDTRHGLKHYGRIIDSDKLPEIHKMITPAHLEQALEEFTGADPAIVVVGDLS